MRLIDADDFGNRMYRDAFEKDSDLQKWDSGCWIRYKLFENVLREQPTVQPDHNADIGKKVSISCGHENDLISRQAALKELAVYIHMIDKTMGKGTLTDDDCMEAAKSVLGEDELPAVQPEPHWIPCSERLPVPKGHVPYLITEAHYKPEYKGRYVTIDWYDARDPECPPSWDDHGTRDGVRVIAWQPLPEPYRGGDSE